MPCSSEKRVNKTVNNHYISQSLVMKISRDKAEFALAGMTFAGMSRDKPKERAKFWGHATRGRRRKFISLSYRPPKLEATRGPRPPQKGQIIPDDKFRSINLNGQICVTMFRKTSVFLMKGTEELLTSNFNEVVAHESITYWQVPFSELSLAELFYVC